MADSQTPNPAAENANPANEPAGNSAPASPETDKSPAWEGDFDATRAARLVDNLRGDLAKQKATNADLAKRLGEREDAEKSELQKLSDRAERAERELTEARTLVLVAKAAREHGIPDELVDFIFGANEDEINAKAERLAERIGSGKTAELPGKPKPKLVPGHGGNDEPGQLTREDLIGMSPTAVDKARREGRLNALLGKSG